LEPVKPIPFVDLHAQYLSIKPEIDAAIAEVIASSAFIRGRFVDEFEEAFAKAVGVKHCVSCANGSDALFLAMRALGIKPGDEVIVPAHSWISTASMVTHAGGKVVFCDTELDSFLIDPQQIESKITSKTVGIIPVHLFGQPADMDEIMAIAKKHGLWVVEDCAQAHMATYRGEQVGTFGDAGCFSFYPGKNLGAMGDAGAIVTNDKSLAEKVSMFARHGGLTKNVHEIEGINSRMDGLQAAILSVKLQYLSVWNKKRSEIAASYNEGLSQVNGIVTPCVKIDRSHVWHLYVVRCDTRESIEFRLKQAKIGYNINYPKALPTLPAYKYLAKADESFPVAIANAATIISLPIYPEIGEIDVSKIIEVVNRTSTV